MSVAPFSQLQAVRFVMAVARLLLLCRKARALPAEALMLVHGYLVAHVGASCPAWLKQMLEAKVLAVLPRGVVYRYAMVSFRVSHQIDYEMYSVDFHGRPTWERTMVAMHGQPVQVDVHMWYQQERPGFFWRLECRQGDNLLRSCEGLWLSDFSAELSVIRSCFTETEPHGCMEVPVTWRDWRRYIRLWLFGPGARRMEPQGNLVAGCRECGKSSMPATHLHGEAFCSQVCADSYVVLSYRCWSCRAPLNSGQKMCRICPAGQAALRSVRRNAAFVGRCWGCQAPVTWLQQVCLNCPEEQAAQSAQRDAAYGM